VTIAIIRDMIESSVVGLFIGARQQFRLLEPVVQWREEMS